MDYIVLVHGLLGSRLVLPERNGDPSREIWPGRVLKALAEGGYPDQDFPDLRDPTASSTEIIRRICVVGVHDRLMRDLDDLAEYASANCGPTKVSFFHYDWRKNNIDSAQQLADHIIELGATSVTLVCHSNGGNVGRLVLESGDHPDAQELVKGYVGLANPNFGATLSLAGALGLEASELLKPYQVAELSKVPGFSTVYQNMPHAEWQKFVVDGSPVDPYDQHVMTNPPYNFDPANHAEAVAHGLKLNFANKPADCEYTLIAGVGHPTLDILEHYPAQPPDQRYKRKYGNGDGTVPKWSADVVPPPGTTGFESVTIPGDHLFSNFRSNPFRNALFAAVWKTLCRTEPLMPASVSPVTVSLNKRVYTPAEQMSVLVIHDDARLLTGGRVSIARLEQQAENEWVDVEEVASVEVTDEHVEDGYASLTLEAPARPDPYMARFEGGSVEGLNPADTATGFAVAAMGG